MKKPVLYLMLGYPGAGKTTAAEIISSLTGAVRLSSDAIRLQLFRQPNFSEAEHHALYDAIDNKTEKLLGAGISVIYDANLNRRIHRQEKYDICKRANATPILVWVQTPRAMAKQRATKQATHDPKRPYGNMTVQVFERLVSQIEQPDDDEPTLSLKGVNLTPRIVKQKLKNKSLKL